MIDWPQFLFPDYHLDFWTILIGALTNSCCAILGCYLVLKRMSMLGDAISHAVLPGLAIAFLTTHTLNPLPMFAWALAFGVITSVLTQTIHKFGNVSEDASLGVVFTSLFALGVVLIQAAQTSGGHNASNVHLDMDAVLEGQLGLAVFDTTTIAGIAFPTAFLTLTTMLAIVLLFVSLLWKELKITTFDPQLATAIGFSTTLVHYLLVTMVAGVTVASFKMVGAILVVAMLIIPPVTAQLFCQRMSSMMFVSVIVAINSAILGYYGAIVINCNIAGVMVVAAGVQYFLGLLFAPRVGFLSKQIQRRALRTRIAAEDILGALYRTEEQTAASVIHSQGSGIIQWNNERGARRRAISSLLLQNLVLKNSADSSIALTEEGRKAAIALVRAHRLWERFLDEHFDLPVDHLHEVAERVEHYLGPVLQEEVAKQLDNATQDPHGQAIPQRPNN